MADEEKKILLSIKLETGDIIVKQANLATAIGKAKTELDKLKKATGEGTVEYQNQKAELQNLQREYKNSNNILQLNQRIIDAKNGSYEKLLNVTKKMEIELKLMGHEGDTTSKKFLELTAAVGKNKEALNVFNQGINVGTANTGRYAESMVDIRAELKALQSQLQNLDPGTKEFNDAAEKAGVLKEKIKDAKDATEAFATESKAQTGLTLFRQIGGDITDLDFKGAAEKARTFTSVLKTITPGEITSGIKDLGVTIINLGKTLLVNPFLLLAAGVVGLIKVLSDLPAAFDEGNTSAKAAKERLDGVVESTRKLRSELYNLSIDNKVINKEISSSAGELLKQREDFRNKSIDLEKERLAELKKINEEFDKEREDDGFKATKNLLEFFGVETNAVQKRNESIAAANKQFNENFNLQQEILLAKNKQIYAKDAEERNLALNKTLDFIKETRQKIKEVNEENRQKEIAEQKAHNEIMYQLKLDLNLMFSNADLQRINEEDEAKKEKKKKDLEAIAESEKTNQDELGKEQFKANEKLRIQEEADQKRIDQAVKTSAVISDVTQAVTDAVTASLEEGRINVEKFGKVLASQLLGIVEKIALTQIAASTTQSLAQPDSVATFGASGIVRAGILTALIKAAVTIARNQLQKAENGAVIPLAEKGIILGGQPHSRGGTTISADGVPIAEAERGELLTIVNKRSTGMLQGLSNLNVAGGGIPFMKHGGIPEFQSGGIPVLNDQFNNVNMMMNAIKNLPHPVVAVQDIIEAIGKLTEVKNKANI